MKKVLLGVLAAGMTAAPAFASELEDYCVAYTTQSAGDPSGCSCLADAADDAMAEELMTVQSEADLETLSDASKEAIAMCWPEA